MSEVLFDAIKHFTGLQKRYMKTHNEQQCQHVAVAIWAMKKAMDEMVQCTAKAHLPDPMPMEQDNAD